MESVKTILAIDDNRDILYTLEQIFNFQGWRPLLANGYEEADKLIKKEKIDLILVDYHMPGVDGISAVRRSAKSCRRYRLLFSQLRRRIGLYQNLWQPERMTIH